MTLTNPNGRGTIYYTLDGSVPTPSNGTAYAGAITIPNSAAILTAIVWPANGLSGGAYVGKFKTISDIFGTSGVTWSRSGTGSWREGTTAGTLRAGGMMNGTYTATLQGTVTGKGRLVFTYLFNSYSWDNTFEFSKNGTRQFRYAYDGTVTRSGTVTDEVTSDGTTSFSWTFTVNSANYDFDDRYSDPSGVWLSNVQWIPEKLAVDVNGVSVPYTWLDGYYPNQGGSAAAYEALATADSDGDGFPAWQEYLLDTDPTDYASRLYATISMEGTTPIFGWSHTNANIQALGYQYVPKGRTALDDSDAWQPFAPGHRFFKVAVEPISSSGN